LIIENDKGKIKIKIFDWRKNKFIKFPDILKNVFGKLKNGI